MSADLYDHAVASFIEPILAQLAGYPSLELHAYYGNNIDDAVTARIRTRFEHWEGTFGRSTRELTAKILADRIDILIDLSGHTAFNRLSVFARKAAPVQVSWLGYPGTTGLRAMDYFLADRHFLPPGSFDGQFTEKLVHLPAAAIFQASERSPPVNPLPGLEAGHITFPAVSTDWVRSIL